MMGLGALFEQGSKEPYFKDDELFGIGQLLKKLSEEASKVHDELRAYID